MAVRNGFPRPVVGMLLTFYGLSVVGLLGWFAYYVANTDFASNTGVVPEQRCAGAVADGGTFGGRCSVIGTAGVALQPRVLRCR
jgi:hypothetical protein